MSGEAQAIYSLILIDFDQAVVSLSHIFVPYRIIFPILTKNTSKNVLYLIHV